MTRVAACPVLRSASKDEPAAHTCGDDHPHHVVYALAGTHPVFRQSDCEAVGGQDHRRVLDMIREDGADQVAQGETPPRGNVDRGDGALGLVDGSSTTDAGAQERRACR